MERIQNNNPFLALLKEQNLTKIKIDKELIPIFKIVISMMSDYFVANDLINVKDWNSFFEKFLLTNNEEQLYIKLGNIGGNVEPVGGEYSKEKKIIAINKVNDDINRLCSSLCHEFIHFLVMHDSNSLNAKISDSPFFNESMTEYLSGCIMGTGNTSYYFREYEMAEFYCKIAKNPFSRFLNDKFAFDDDYYAPINLIRSSQRFQNDHKLDSYLSVQRQIISRGLDDYSINSFEDFVNIVTIINQRPRFDGDYINTIFERIIDKYVTNLNLNEQQRTDIMNKLITFCKVSNKYQLYGENEVAEFLIDDLHIAFDKKGQYYNDFPLDGINKRGQISFDGISKITVTHKDKNYIIDTGKMNCRNWKVIYNKTYAVLKKEFDLLDMQAMNNSGSQFSIKR